MTVNRQRQKYRQIQKNGQRKTQENYERLKIDKQTNDRRQTTEDRLRKINGVTQNIKNRQTKIDGQLDGER